MYNNLVKGASDGAIIDIHDLSPTSVEGSLRAIDTLQQQGYEFVTVSDLMIPGGTIDKAGVMHAPAE